MVYFYKQKEENTMLNAKYPLNTPVASSSLEIIDEHLKRIERISQLNDSSNEYKDELISIVLNSLKDLIKSHEKPIVGDNDLEKKKYYTIREVEDLLGVKKEAVYRYMDVLGIDWDRNQPRIKSLIESGYIPRLIDLARWSKENRGKELRVYLVERPVDGIAYYTVDEVLKKVGIGRTTLYSYLEILRLPHIKKGNRRLIKVSDLDLLWNLSIWSEKNQGRPLEDFLREKEILQRGIVEMEDFISRFKY